MRGTSVTTASARCLVVLALAIFVIAGVALAAPTPGDPGDLAETLSMVDNAALGAGAGAVAGPQDTLGNLPAPLPHPFVNYENDVVTVFNDADADGVKDPGEMGVSGPRADVIFVYDEASNSLMVFVDQNGDGIRVNEPGYTIPLPGMEDLDGLPLEDLPVDRVEVNPLLTNGYPNGDGCSGGEAAPGTGVTCIEIEVVVDQNGDGDRDPGEATRLGIGTQLAPDMDYDGDGYSNRLEILSGFTISQMLTNWLSATATPQDRDGDGFSNLEERDAETDPDDEISHPNRPPAIELVNPPAIIDEGALTTIEIRGVDPDPSQQVSLTSGLELDLPEIDCANVTFTPLAGSPVSAAGEPFTIDCRTILGTGENEGELDFVGVDHFAWGQYRVSVRVTDHGYASGGPTTSQPITVDSTFVLTVRNVDRAPVVTFSAPRTVAEAATLAVAVTAVDPDGTPTSLPAATPAVGWPSWATLARNASDASRGTITLAPSHDVVSHAGALSLVRTLPFVNATSPSENAPQGALTTEASVAVTVTDVNRAPRIAPADVAGNESTAFEVPLNYVDDDGDAATPTVGALPAGANNGTFVGTTWRWTPGQVVTASAPPLVASLAFTVTDGFGGSVTDSAQFTIANANLAPALSGTLSAVVSEGSAVAGFHATATDPDLEEIPSLRFSVTPALPSWAALDAVEGTILGTPPFDTVTLAAGYRYFNGTITVTDGDLTDSKPYSIRVNNVNRAPTISTITAPATSENVKISFTIPGRDDDVDNTLAYSFAATPPAGASLNATGTFEYTPPYEVATRPNPVQLVSFTVRVSDGAASANRTFTVAVTHVNRAPDLAAITLPALAEASSRTNPTSAVELDLFDNLTWSVSDHNASWVAVNPATGNLSFAPGYRVVVHPARTLNETFTVRVTDQEGAFDEVTTTIRINDVNRVPVISFSPNLTATTIPWTSADLTYVFVGERILNDLSDISYADADPEDALGCKIDVLARVALTCDPLVASFAAEIVDDATTWADERPRLRLNVTDGIDVVTTAYSPRFSVLARTGDFDGDNLQNVVELEASANTGVVQPGLATDPTIADTDADGYTDREETDAESDPNNPLSTPGDLDGDGLPNAVDATLENPFLNLNGPLAPVRAAINAAATTVTGESAESAYGEVSPFGRTDPTTGLPFVRARLTDGASSGSATACSGRSFTPPTESDPAGLAQYVTQAAPEASCLELRVLVDLEQDGDYNGANEDTRVSANLSGTPSVPTLPSVPAPPSVPPTLPPGVPPTPPTPPSVPPTLPPGVPPTLPTPPAAPTAVVRFTTGAPDAAGKTCGGVELAPGATLLLASCVEIAIGVDADADGAVEPSETTRLASAIPPAGLPAVPTPPALPCAPLPDPTACAPDGVPPEVPSVPPGLPVTPPAPPTLPPEPPVAPPTVPPTLPPEVADVISQLPLP